MASSSNPFRRQTTQHKENSFPSIDTIDSPSVLPLPKTSFRDQSPSPVLQSIDTKKANKVVKKVRVLSPPPRSPDSPEWPAGVRPPGDRFANPSFTPHDPFASTISDDSDWENTAASTPPPPHHRQPGLPQAQVLAKTTTQVQSPVQIPLNPFSRTLQDIEGSKDLKEDMREEGEVLKAANNSRKSLNVDSFKRLLMTGASSLPSSPPPIQNYSAQPHPETSTVPPTSKTVPTSEPAATGQTNREKKAPPPPPPSSRHGRSIKSEQRIEPEVASGAEEDVATEPVESSRSGLARVDTSDSSESLSTAESIESAQRPVLHPRLASDLEKHNPPSLAPSSKKPLPAPPPRRGHTRTESKLDVYSSSNTDRARSSSNPLDNDPPSRSSLDSASTPSRSSSVRRGANIPLPPPPRRAPVGPKSSVPSTPTLDSTVQTKPPDPTAKHAAPRPPPPPTRNASVRRPLSFLGTENTSRRTSAEGKQRDNIAPPPPPPARHRGSSQGSIDGPPPRSSMDSTSRYRPSMDGHGAVGDLSMTPVQPGVGKSVDILADLDALQREVDALRGKVG